MSFRISFETCNAAFGEPGDTVQFRTEVKRILRRVVAVVEAGADEGPIMDINGNKVGSWSLDMSCGCDNTARHEWNQAEGVKR